MSESAFENEHQCSKGIEFTLFVLRKVSLDSPNTDTQRLLFKELRTVLYLEQHKMPF